MGRQRNGTATASETRPKAMNTLRPRSSPTAGASARWVRQATSITVGSSAAESRADTGGGASLWASGSQLCTGAQPTLVARPQKSSKKPTTAAERGIAGAAAASPCQESPAKPALRSGRAA